MTQTEALTILAIAGTLLGVAIGILGTYFVSVRLARNHAKALAALRLRDAFAPEVARLQHLDSAHYYQTQDILKVAFDKHQMAVNEFGFFLDHSKLKALNEVWKEYCTVYGEYCDFYQYNKDPHVAIDRIDAIIGLTRK